jgi:uncharacterized repeat protein (TIGR02059 family)
MRKVLTLIFLSISSVLSSQTILTIEGQTYVNTITGIWNGVEIPRTTQTDFKFLNNSITSVNYNNYMLLAGDEAPANSNNNLDGSVITGNKLTWNGSDDKGGCHGLFVGFNINDVIKYNYLNHVPYGVVFKSGTGAGFNMTNTSGGFAYNIVRNSYIGVRIKGINGVCVYNNTFFDDVHTSLPAIIYITSNSQAANPSYSTGTKIKNNIFYTKHPINYIYVEQGSESGFECDYNIYFCENGAPRFQINNHSYSFLQWQALGYDTHSYIINPNFLNTSSLVPEVRLNSATDLGPAWKDGLSTNADWIVGSSPATRAQDGTWQVGARISDITSIIPYYVSSSVENATPTILEITFNLTLANIAPAGSAFTVKVNSVTANVILVRVSGKKVLLTLANRIVYGDKVTVAYTKPTSSVLQSASGGQATTFSAQNVTNNCKGSTGPFISLISPADHSSFLSPATIVIEAIASDPTGSIVKVEFFNGKVRLAELTTTPYSYTWTDVPAGTYLITAIATDNLNAAVSDSSLIEVKDNQGYDADSDILKLYPNPNVGHFSINFISPLKKKIMVTIVNCLGKAVYSESMLEEENSREFDLSFIDPGIYILMITDNEILVTKKFIKI